jgi:hypothetical protein
MTSAVDDGKKQTGEEFPAVEVRRPVHQPATGEAANWSETTEAPGLGKFAARWLALPRGKLFGLYS